MRAVLATQPGVLGLGELPMPSYDEYEALVQMEACAICNSTDHKLLTNEFFPGAFPVALGHEVIGRVVEVGSKVTSFKPGDRVFRQRLRDADVPGGRSCWGGFAEFGVVEDLWAKEGLPYGNASLPHDQQKLLLAVPAPQAAAMITLMETLDCLVTCRVGTGMSVAVVGSGPVAQAFALFARLLGAKTVYAFGRRAVYTERFTRVSRVDGYVVGDEYPAEVEKIVSSGGFDVVMEAVGSAAALDRCLALSGTTGAVCIYGIPPKSAPYRTEQTERPGIQWVGAMEGRAQRRLVQFIDSRTVRLEDWVSHVLPLAQYQQAFDLVESKEGTKVVLVP
jgi:threonine dehydrogenase-like Zn-dependent dehydrogenase